MLFLFVRSSVLRQHVRQNRQFSGCFTSNFSTNAPQSLSVRLRLTIDPRVCGFNVNARYLHTSSALDCKASSKVEETVNRLKEKHEKTQQEASAGKFFSYLTFKTVRATTFFFLKLLCKENQTLWLWKMWLPRKLFGKESWPNVSIITADLNYSS
jgi:hypothetical protein